MREKAKLNIEFNYTSSRTVELGSFRPNNSSEQYQSSSRTQSSNQGNRNHEKQESNIGARARFQMATQSLDPTPQEVFPTASQSVTLTLSQSNVLSPGGPELTNLVFKLLKNKTEKVNNLKILLDNYRLGTITVDSLLSSFIEIVESLYTCINNQVFVEMGHVWKRMADVFPEDQYLLSTYENLLKKSKRKGLSVKEFDTMKSLEPKKTTMLSAWNNYKIRITQDNQPEVKEQKTGWDNSSNQQQPKARVLVIDSSKKATSSSKNSLTSKVGGLRINSRPSVQEFPILPAVVEPSQNGWAAPSPSNRSNNNQQQSSTNKKGKKVLLKFG